MKAESPVPSPGEGATVKIENHLEDASLEEKVPAEIKLKEADDDETKMEITADKPVKRRKPPLFNDLPSAKAEAIEGFEVIDRSIYQYKYLGDSAQGEIMTCECRPEYQEGENHACGSDSECINRMTSIECISEECSCGNECQNQRFQRQEYANVDVIKTENKGYGLRAMEDLPGNLFVYEYIGEVVDEGRFRNRMTTYDKQGIKHFYFMMLQNGEYIDATRKGCLARFCNHSCMPNCYVDKWVVGTKLKMGIFTKRAITKGEELTFDYNVDRYGANPQVCYCDEPNCVGFIGGKTQTDNAIKLPPNLIEALGLNLLDDWEGLTSKKKKNKKQQQDYGELLSEVTVPQVDEAGVTKIMGVLLQHKEQWIVHKLVQRLSFSDDQAVQRRVMKLHGYQILGGVLSDWKDEVVITKMILEILAKWPRLTRNKISSAKIEPIVKSLSEEGEGKVQELAVELLEEWSTLQMAYRIPRRQRTKSENIEDQKQEKEEEESAEAEETRNRTETGPSRDDRYEQARLRRSKSSARPFRPNLPYGWDAARDVDGRVYYVHTATGTSQWEIPKDDSAPATPLAPTKAAPKVDLQSVIEQASKQFAQESELAKKEGEEKRAAAKEARARKSERAERKKRERESGKKLDSERKRHTKKSHPKEHRKHESSSKRRSHAKGGPSANTLEGLKRNLARFVPNVTAKFQDRLGKEDFKKRAKEIVEILVGKEKAKGKRTTPDLSESDKSKIKKWALVYMEKVHANHLKKKTSSSQSQETPETGEQGQKADRQEATPTSAPPTDPFAEGGDTIKMPSSSEDESDEEDPQPVPISAEGREPEDENEGSESESDAGSEHSHSHSHSEDDAADDRDEEARRNAFVAAAIERSTGIAPPPHPPPAASQVFNGDDRLPDKAEVDLANGHSGFSELGSQDAPDQGTMPQKRAYEMGGEGESSPKRVNLEEPSQVAT